MKLTDNWEKLSAQEKYEERFKRFANPAIKFASPEVEKAYKDRVQMLKDVIELKKPSRVPIALAVGAFPAFHAGFTPEDMMYDYEKLGIAYKKFNKEFEIDTLTSGLTAGPGKVFEILDYKLYQWPGGGGLSPETPYQYVEKEYMLDEEYDLLINDPSAYWMRYYLPRTFGVMAPWAAMTSFTDIIELPFAGPSMIPFGIPAIQESLKKLMQAGDAALEWIGAIGAMEGEIQATQGLPGFMGGFAKAPFDTLGDTMRGTRPIMLDMFRRPKKLLEALDRLVALNVDMGVRAANSSGVPIIFIPLHKGADGFLSSNDFNKFYWPTLKAVILGLINEGLVPYLFAEGGYNQRLNDIMDSDIPEGKTMWLFDTTDMVSVKKALGGKACFGGNVPGSMLKVGTPQQVEEYVKFLMENVAQDGGFILSNGSVLDDAEADNLHAMINAGKKYGEYK
ncbi:MAG: hypothetical protein APF76_02865 [Desulfitibacter sp. BRH_c19]|nr:MAG: hypothetical protein APF76_02865 [Desulfitibacter sp. BRH_c19]